MPKMGSPPPTATSKFLTTQARQTKVKIYKKNLMILFYEGSSNCVDTSIHYQQKLNK